MAATVSSSARCLAAGSISPGVNSQKTIFANFILPSGPIPHHPQRSKPTREKSTPHPVAPSYRGAYHPPPIHVEESALDNSNYVTPGILL